MSSTKRSIAVPLLLAGCFGWCALDCGGARADESRPVSRDRFGARLITVEGKAPRVSEGWGTLQGKVVFRGDAPQPRVLLQAGRRAFRRGPIFEQPIISQRLLVDPKSNGVKDALVWIPHPTGVHAEAQAAARSAEVPFVADQGAFEPHVLALMAGAKIVLRSRGSIVYDVHVHSRQNPINSLLMPRTRATVQLERGDDSPIRVSDDIHPWMRSWWLVADTPYFAVTDERGRFEIRQVPAGFQRVCVWQESAGFLSDPEGDAVLVRAAGKTSRIFVLAAEDVRPE